MGGAWRSRDVGPDRRRLWPAEPWPRIRAIEPSATIRQWLAWRREAGGLGEPRRLFGLGCGRVGSTHAVSPGRILSLDPRLARGRQDQPDGFFALGAQVRQP